MGSKLSLYKKVVEEKLADGEDINAQVTFHS
jgi:hypothetical protein